MKNGDQTGKFEKVGQKNIFNQTFKLEKNKCLNKYFHFNFNFHFQDTLFAYVF